MSIQNLNLNQAVKPFSQFVPKTGIAKAKVQALIDTQWNFLPEGKANIEIQDFHFPSSSFDTPFGPMNFPSVQFSSIILKGTLKDKTLTLDEVVLGSKKNPLYVELKGYLELDIIKKNRNPLKLNTYQVKVHLDLSSSLQQELSLILSPFSKYKKTQSGKTQYRFKVDGKGQRSIPRLSAL